jgi:hypothetical protein
VAFAGAFRDHVDGLAAHGYGEGQIHLVGVNDTRIFPVEVLALGVLDPVEVNLVALDNDIAQRHGSLAAVDHRPGEGFSGVMEGEDLGEGSAGRVNGGAPRPRNRQGLGQAQKGEHRSQTHGGDSFQRIVSCNFLRRRR